MLMLTPAGTALITAQLNTTEEALQLVEKLKTMGAIGNKVSTSEVEYWFTNFSQKL